MNPYSHSNGIVSAPVLKIRFVPRKRPNKRQFTNVTISRANTNKKLGRLHFALEKYLMKNTESVTESDMSCFTTDIYFPYTTNTTFLV